MRYLSLFSGIEAASVAWRPLGWQCVGVAEIEPFACAVLAHHYPNVPNLGSVTDITDAQIAALGPIDVVVGGSPCQDLSVAGKRVGLAGERSGLFHEQLRIFHAARHLCGARFIVWENVPGAFSTHGGRDFAVVVGAMAGCELPVPEDGWGTEGVALGEHGLVEWAVLDAQWFGVAQRRRRVFAVLDVGDWASRPPILLERDSLRGDSAPSREAGQSVADSLVARAGRNGGASNSDVDARHVIAFGGNNQSGPIDVATARNACASASGRMDFESETFLVQPAHTLRGEGFDASEDGTGRGTPLVPVVAPCLTSNYGKQPDSSDTSAGPMLVPVPIQNATRGKDQNGLGIGHAGDPMYTLDQGSKHAIAFAADDYKDGGYEECDTSRPLTTSADRTRAAPVIAFSGKDYGADAGEVAPTLRSMGHDGSHANGGGQVAVAFAHQAGGTQTTLGYDPELGTAPTLAKCQTPAVHAGMQVRRLTPRECARLQGFPDDYLDITYRGRPAADGPKYKALGNSMAVPVMRWIGEAIMRIAA